MTPIEIACTHADVRPGRVRGDVSTLSGDDVILCNAQAGEPCSIQITNGVLRHPDKFHEERIADAAAMTQDSPDPPSKEDFERAVDETGLV